jgi:hypothetical protein
VAGAATAVSAPALALITTATTTAAAAAAVSRRAAHAPLRHHAARLHRTQPHQISAAIV